MEEDSTFKILEQGERRKITLIGQGILVGFFAGLVSVIYRYFLNKSEKVLFSIIDFVKGNPFYIIIWFIILIILSIIVGKLIKWEPMSSGSGIPQVTGEIKGFLDPIWWKVIISKIIGGTICIIGGLSLGREGPSVQLGAMSGKGVARLLKINKTDERYLISCGASAGLSAAFNAPFAGIMFALEEIHKNFSPSVLLCAMASAVTSDYVSKSVFGLSPVFNFEVEGMVPLKYYWLLIFLGLIVGGLGAFYNKSMLFGQDIYKKIKFLKPEYYIIVPFLVSGVLGFFIPKVLAGGHEMIILLENQDIFIGTILILLIVKFLFSAICFGSGAIGGIFFPLLILGAYIGAIFGMISNQFFALPEEYIINFIILAMAGFFTAIVRAPITSIILIAEMTGSFSQLLSLTVVSIVAYVVASILKSVPIYESLLDRILVKQNKKQLDINSNKVILTFVVASGSDIDSKRISEINLPKHCLIVEIKRGEKSIIPRGKTRILAGDFIEVLVNSDELSDIYDDFQELCFERQWRQK